MTTTPPTAPHGAAWRLVRLTAPLVRQFAGRRFFPAWAVVHHRGRTTGRELAVPVAILAVPEGFLINLPWGAGTNWARNVIAAGGCVVRWRGVDHRVERPELVGPDRARPHFSPRGWAVAQRLFGAETFLLLHRSP